MVEEGIGSSQRKEGEHRMDKHIYQKKKKKFLLWYEKREPFIKQENTSCLNM